MFTDSKRVVCCRAAGKLKLVADSQSGARHFKPLNAGSLGFSRVV